MKTTKLLLCAFCAALGLAACDNIQLGELESNPSEGKTFKVRLVAGGEIDVTQNPLTRFEADDRDLYGIQVLHKPATTGSYTHYAYGLFDNIADLELEVQENYKYEIEVTLIDDGKDKIYCDSVLVDSEYYLGYDQPFRGKNNYNGSTAYSITKLTNEFTYGADSFFSGNVYIKTKDGKESGYAEDVDFYWGKVSDYTATKDGEELSIYLKRMVFGVKINIGDFFDNGTITLDALNKTYTFTPDNRSIEKTFAYYSNDTKRTDWYKEEDLDNAKTASLSFDFKWEKADGIIVDWKPVSIYCNRLKQTVLNLDYYGEDEVLGNNKFVFHYDDTLIENEYKSYTYGSEQDNYNW